MKLASFETDGRESYGVVAGGGVVDIGRRLGGKYPTLRAALAGNALGDIAGAVGSAAPDIALEKVS